MDYIIDSVAGFVRMWREKLEGIDMLKMENVPYRKWGSGGRYHGKLVECAEGKRVMSLMFKEMAAGKAVDFRQNPPIDYGIDKATEKNIKPIGGVYDTISLTITD